MGYATTNKITITSLVSQIVLAPMKSPWREHTACGAISPNITISVEDTSNPMGPDVRSADKIARSPMTTDKAMLVTQAA